MMMSVPQPGMNTTINTAMASINSSINASMMSDAMSEPSSPESAFDDSDLMAVHDDVTVQLANAGPIGVAAAAAIATSKKRKRPHSFETNPSVRKRQQTRLLRKLRATIEEYTTRVGQQAVVLACTPAKTQQLHSFRVFGSQPLENVLRGRRPEIMGDLDAALAHQAPAQQPDNPALHELPPLIIDGIPTPVDKMTQAQLRAFIPEMLKYSTGRSKPGWGKIECRPIWWPDDVPWANVRSDVRTEEQKKRVSWTHALRTIVRNCYKHHGRDDLLPEFSDDPNSVTHATVHPSQFTHQTMVQTINNPDGSVSVIQIDTGETGNPQVITLADGTQAQVVHTIPNGFQPQHEAHQAVHTLAEVATNHNQELAQAVSVEVNHDQAHAQNTLATLTEGTINQDGQLVLTGDPNALAGVAKTEISAGQAVDNKLGQIIGMVTIPVSMYQTVVTNLSQLGDVHQSGALAGLPPGAIQVVAPHSAATQGTLPGGVQVITSANPTQLVTVESLQHHQHHQHHPQEIPLADGTIAMVTEEPETESEIKPEEDDDDDDEDLDEQDVEILTKQEHGGGDVPDATQAVEVMSVDQS